MNKKHALYILAGLVLGAIFGGALGSAIKNAPLATGLGAVGGVFLGWFITAVVREMENEKNEKEK